MKLGIIIGSTRQGRQTDKQARWVLNAASKMDGVEAELVDLRDYPMPFFDEPMSPRYNQDRHIDPLAQPWLKKMESFDAYVFVTPEYNHSIPGVLKNALDYVTWEIQRKPASVISHGSAGGARAQLMLKIILSESKAVPLPTFTPLTMAGMSEQIDDNGELTKLGHANPRDPQSALQAMLDELKWYSDALAAARAKD
ncbi:MAG TPA: NAD(P)H-dependent oxidoreductase [Candidatus Saccharimonadales bacterium]|nr:NAD(P)H-dependent oxidoreductase [Candidatus Saccharimonadales bacterium]